MNRIKLFLTILCLSVLTSCKKSGDDQIFISFINHTGEPIENAQVQNRSLGDLAAGEKTPWIPFTSFGTDTGMPDERFTGQQGGQMLEGSSMLFWCGTEKSKLPPGTYTIGIKRVIMGNREYFSLAFE